MNTNQNSNANCSLANDYVLWQELRNFDGKITGYTILTGTLRGMDFRTKKNLQATAAAHNLNLRKNLV